MSSFKGSSISTARRVLRESRTMRESTSLEYSPRATPTHSGTVSRGFTVDLEAPLLEQRTAEAAALADLAAVARRTAAGGEADAAPGSPGPAAGPVAAAAVATVDGGDAERLQSGPSLTSPAYQEARDSRSLWRAARRNLGEQAAAAGRGCVIQRWWEGGTLSCEHGIGSDAPCVLLTRRLHAQCCITNAQACHTG